MSREKCSHVYNSLLEQDGVTLIERAAIAQQDDTLIYCDPPYVRASRKSKRAIYQFEMNDAGHVRLLEVIKALPCRVMISGYRTPLYQGALRKWNSISYMAVTRGGGIATEYLWFNFPPPIALHDYRYLGKDFRERERIKRKKARWASRLRNMPDLERHALMRAIETAWEQRQV